jgi:GT2 family glycosyltransferase
VGGKFLYRGDEKLYVRGVTYGPFRPSEEFADGLRPDVAERDLAAIAESGFNALRLYSVPGRWFLDAAQRHGLLVMIGLPWEEHVAFLGDRRHARDIERRIRAGVRACTRHPAVLGYVVGNEIPASIVRWHGRRRIEAYIERLFYAAKEEDPGGLATYVNYPTTEYLQLPFLDFACFNVYLESREQLAAYLSRLQNIAGDLPLVMAEIGLDSRRNGLRTQAESTEWQVATTFAAGCAGAFIFAWTDEWYRGGHDIEDWDFGLTTRERQPKPALAAAQRAFAELPFPVDSRSPRVSVIVCTYNDARTLRDCLEGLLQLRYPDYEVIVVVDGSADGSAAIVRDYEVRCVETPNRGLASARNTGLAMATGDVVAFIDADARPDPDWLRYLARSLVSGGWAGIGGPNLPWPDAGRVARAVAEAPGGPTHVLLSDEEAEHIPGCNMAFRRDCLLAIGGFDPRFRAAGDDVDVCWRLRERGWKLGFSPGAAVWHHRRESLFGYLRQQRVYGEAEGLLERKWPQRYSAAGHPVWEGRLYGGGAAEHHGRRRWWVYHGTWGTSLFQSIYQPARGMVAALPLIPEYYLLIFILLVLSLGGIAWTPLLGAVPVLGVAVGALVLDAALGAARSSAGRSPSTLERLRSRALVGLLYVLQPLARLHGRLRLGLTPFRRRGPGRLRMPRPRTTAGWSEDWASTDTRLKAIEARLRDSGAVARRGDPYARWDLEVISGPLGMARVRMALEEHGAGRQLVRLRVWPRPSPLGVAIALGLGLLAAGALADRAWVVGVVLAATALVVAARTAQECAAATGSLLSAFDAEVGSDTRLPARGA